MRSHLRDGTGAAQGLVLRPVAPSVTETTPLGPPVVRALVRPRVALRALDGGAGRLLTVREVAERLAVSTATVYALVERGELPHVRVSNAIRVAPADLAAFIEARRVRR